MAKFSDRHVVTQSKVKKIKRKFRWNLIIGVLNICLLLGLLAIYHKTYLLNLLGNLHV